MSLNFEEMFKTHERNLRKIAENEGFVGDIKIEYERGSNDGDGHIGLMARVRIIGVKGDGKSEECLKLICKIPQKSKIEREKYNSDRLFEREVLVYSEVFPEFENIQKQNGIYEGDEDGFWAFPKCYLASNNAETGEAIIIMEDLLERGFSMKDQYVPIDYLHTEKIIIELAKMNAVCFALKEKRKSIFEKIKELDDLLCPLMMTEQMKDLVPRNCKLAASLFDKEEDQHLREKMLELSDCLWEKTFQYIDPKRAEPFAVLSHGDCWTNNIMFTYKNDGKTIANVCLLDWQMAHYGSPALDIVLFIYLCTHRSLKINNFEVLLQIYYSSLSKTLKRLQCDPEQTFPRSTIKEHVQKFGLVALAMATFAIPIVTKYPEEIFLDTKNAEKEEHQAKIQAYRETMEFIIRDTHLFGYL